MVKPTKRLSQFIDILPFKTMPNNCVGIDFRLSGKTESFVVEGVSVDHDLVPLITSEIGVYGMCNTDTFYTLLIR